MDAVCLSLRVTAGYIQSKRREKAPFKIHSEQTAHPGTLCYLEPECRNGVCSHPAFSSLYITLGIALPFVENPALQQSASSPIFSHSSISPHNCLPHSCSGSMPWGGAPRESAQSPASRTI